MLQQFQLEFEQAAKCKPVNIVWLFEFIKNGLFWLFGKKIDNKKPLVLIISKSSKN
jgi:hypothetical protein